MLAVMSKVRLVVMVEEEIRDALRLESALAGRDMSEIVEDLIRDRLADAMQKIRERRAKKSKNKE